ncbi:oligopeptide ABC transporter permease [Aquisalibacillus elongatus]|uniref:Peptide/nickel transport system permease protein n=1 Tax=Aquisalibacillus elongatus TaxID=485577 RepID=A0A3N5C1I1_9BACI|nr:oligopeptide ABC transporter permease [Aquisalibacillus elongatus]RPF50041.1 peptide/nickel transport system permease protein [Aquisalibacillus elongatus]
MEIETLKTPKNDPEYSGAPEEKSKSPYQLALRRFMKNKLAVLGVITMIIILFMSISAPLWTDHDPEQTNTAMIERPPSDEHILGTNSSGQDNWARLLYGSRISLAVGFSTMFVTLVIGILFGSLAGYYGGKVDSILMRFTDLVLALPFLVFALTLMAILNNVSIPLFILILSILSWPNLTRIIRGSFLSLREQEFVIGAKSIGASNSRIIFRHMIPNTIGPIVVNATLMIAVVIIAEAGLSFIGMGINPPTPTWGNMLNEALSVRILRQHWYTWIPPGVAIFITVLAINFIGDGLRDAFDPKSNQR